MNCAYCQRPGTGQWCSDKCRLAHTRALLEGAIHHGLKSAAGMLAKAIQEHGSGAAAARALGVPLRTWRRWEAKCEMSGRSKMAIRAIAFLGHKP